MAEEIAKLKAAIEIDSKNAEQEVKKIDKQFRDLEKNIKKLDETLKFTQELLKNISFSKGGNDFKVLNESLNTFKNTISKLGSDLKIFKTELSEISKMALRIKQDTAKVDLKEMQQAVNKANSTIKELKNTILENKNEMEKLKNQSLKNAISTESYMQSLEKTKQAINKTRVEEEKLNATRQKTTLKQLTEEEKRLSNIRQTNTNINNKSIINEQKLATEREKTRKATTQAEQAELRLSKQKDNLNKSTDKSNGLWSTLTTRFTVAGIAVNAITGLFNKLTSSIRESSTEALNFQKNMALSNTILDVSKDGINKLSTQVAEMGTKLGKAPSEMAMGLYDVASSTDSTVDRLKVLEIATKASVAGFTDVSTAVDTGIGMMNAFGLETSDLNRIYDLQFKTVDRGIVSYGELKESLGNMMSSAVNAKVPMEEMLGQLAFLTKQGQNYAKASVALARTYDTVFEKGDKLKKYLDVDVADSNGNLKSTTDILGDMAKELERFDEISQINILEEIGFSDRSSRAIIAVMKNVDGVREEIKLVADGAGSMEQAFKKASDNILTDWQKVKSGIASTFSELIIENEKFIKSMINGFGKFTNVLITGVRVWANLFRGVKENLQDSFNQDKMDLEYRKFEANNKKWLEANKKFVEDSNELLKKDLANSESVAEREQAVYESRLRVLNEFNKRTLSAVEKTVNEKNRLESLDTSITKTSGQKIGAKPKGLEGIRESDYKLIFKAMSTNAKTIDTSKLVGDSGRRTELQNIVNKKGKSFLTAKQQKELDVANKQFEDYKEKVKKLVFTGDNQVFAYLNS